jgi:hypothetical protein
MVPTSSQSASTLMVMAAPETTLAAAMIVGIVAIQLPMVSGREMTFTMASVLFRLNAFWLATQ